MAPDKQADDYFICPSCGAQVPAGADFCRACGASDDLGWDEDGHWWDDELPTGYSEDDDDGFDYDEFISREFGPAATEWSKRHFKRLLLAILVILLCAALVVWTVSRY